VCKNDYTDRFAVWVMDSDGPRKHKLNRIRQVAPMCPTWEDTLAPAHLANTTELSVCGGDAALCQITLESNLVDRDLYIVNDLSVNVMIKRLQNISFALQLKIHQSQPKIYTLF